MKKTLIFAVMLAMCLCGCEKGDDAAVVDSSAVTSAVTEPTDKEPAAPAEKGASPVRGTVYDTYGNVLYYMNYEYDDAGRVKFMTTTTTTGEVRSKIEREYDDAGNEVKVLTYSGETLVRREETVYNGNAKVETVTYRTGDEVDSVAKYECDADGNVVKEVEYNKDGSVSFQFETEYDASGNMLEERQVGTDGSVILRNVYEYNADESMVKLTQYYGDGSLFGYFDYEYDANGNMVKMIEYGSDGKVDLTIVYEY